MTVTSEDFTGPAIRFMIKETEKKIGEVLGKQVFLTYNFKERVVLYGTVSITMTRIMKAVCDYYGYRPSEMMGEIRTPIQMVDARMMFSYLAHKVYAVATLKEVGVFLCLRNHSSISNHCEKTKNFIEVYKEKRVVFNDIKQLIEDPNFIV